MPCLRPNRPTHHLPHRRQDTLIEGNMANCVHSSRSQQRFMWRCARHVLFILRAFFSTQTHREAKKDYYNEASPGARERRLVVLINQQSTVNVLYSFIPTRRRCHTQPMIMINTKHNKMCNWDVFNYDKITKQTKITFANKAWLYTQPVYTFNEYYFNASFLIALQNWFVSSVEIKNCKTVRLYDFHLFCTYSPTRLHYRNWLLSYVFAFLYVVFGFM